MSLTFVLVLWSSLALFSPRVRLGYISFLFPCLEDIFDCSIPFAALQR